MFDLTVRAPWEKNAIYFNAETLWVRERESEREKEPTQDHDSC